MQFSEVLKLSIALHSRPNESFVVSLYKYTSSYLVWGTVEIINSAYDLLFPLPKTTPPTATMTYESKISFTLDTICPWTYLALRRLTTALESLPPSPAVSFRLHFLPYQLYPDLPATGLHKTEWYKKSRYGDSDEKWRMYVTIMRNYGRAVGVDFKFGGTVANTLQAHRVVGRVQERWGEGKAKRLVDGEWCARRGRVGLIGSSAV